MKLMSLFVFRYFPVSLFLCFLLHVHSVPPLVGLETTCTHANRHHMHTQDNFVYTRIFTNAFCPEDFFCFWIRIALECVVLRCEVTTLRVGCSSWQWWEWGNTSKLAVNVSKAHESLDTPVRVHPWMKVDGQAGPMENNPESSSTSKYIAAYNVTLDLLLQNDNQTSVLACIISICVWRTRWRLCKVRFTNHKVIARWPGTQCISYVRGTIFGNLFVHGRANKCVDSYITVSLELSSIKLYVA